MSIYEQLCTGSVDGVRAFLAAHDGATADHWRSLAKRIHTLAFELMLRDPVAFMAFKAREDGPNIDPAIARSVIEAAGRNDLGSVRDGLEALDLDRLHSLMRMALWLDNESRSLRSTALLP